VRSSAVDAKSLYLKMMSGDQQAPDDAIEEEEKKSDSSLSEQELVDTTNEH